MPKIICPSCSSENFGFCNCEMQGILTTLGEE